MFQGIGYSVERNLQIAQFLRERTGCFETKFHVEGRVSQGTYYISWTIEVDDLNEPFVRGK